MVQNAYIKCKFCETIIRLRTQIGYFDCPIFFACPECKTQISGVVHIGQDKPSISYELINAEITDNYKSEYVAEQSVEFPQRKVCKETEGFDLTPFMRSMPSLRNGMEPIERVKGFVLRRETEWEPLKTCKRLFENGKIDIVIQQLKTKFPEQNIINSFDAFMLLQHWLISCVSSALPQNTLKEYIEFSKKISALFKSKNSAMQSFLDYLKTNTVLEKARVRITNLVDDFYKMAEKFMPVLVLINTDTFDGLDKDTLGLSTVGYEELKAFYANSYEELLRLIDILVALNNISERGAYDSISPQPKFKDFEAFLQSKKKYEKLDLVIKTEAFSRPLSLNNRIRNAINHYNVEKDDNEQKIVFIDTYGGKTNKVEMHYIDFAKMCIENFSAIIYISELMYHLEKLLFIESGAIPHIRYHDTQPKTVKRQGGEKVGRNEPCPCGSEKKYKKCCGQNE